MSVSSSVNKISYTGNGATVAFAMTNILVYLASHIQVLLNGVVQVSGFTVSVIPAGGATPTITFTVAPASGVIITLVRTVPFTQLTTYKVAGAFPAKTTETDLDLSTMQGQQLNEVDARTLRIPVESTYTPSTVIPDPNLAANQGKFLRLTASGIDVATPTGSGFIDPLTTKGDLLTRDASALVRVGVGADGQVLTADAAEAKGVKWATPNTTFISPNIVDAAGDIIVATADNTPVRKAVGAVGKVLRSHPGQSDRLLYQFVGPGEDFVGLHIRTSPDDSVRATTIQLERLRYLVTDRGTMVKPRTPLTAVITTAGAGGLDTGSEAASTWYSVHYIFRGADSASPDNPDAPASDALLLHREKDHFADEVHDTGDDVSTVLRRATAPTQTELGQGFQVSNTGLCPFVEAKLIRTGAVAASQFWFEIRADSAGNPGSLLATSDKYDASRLSTTATWTYFPFRHSNLVTLTAATQYHMVLVANYVASDTVNIAWRADSTAPAYANGTLRGLDTGVWVDKAQDAMFRVYITQNEAALTMPANYTERCLLSYVRNDGSSNFVPYVQIGRMISRTGAGSSVTGGAAATPILINLDAIVPPVPISNGMVEVQHGAASIWRIGRGSALDMLPSAVPDSEGVIGFGVNTTGITLIMAEQKPFFGLEPYQRVLMVQQGANDIRMGSFTW